MPDTERPNILLITTHDTGRQIGCYGWPVDTPHLNRLAGEGMRFDNYFCTAPQCSPSRASITTGRYPHSNGMMGLLGYGGWELPDSDETLAKALRQAGYSTHLWGFQHEHNDAAAIGYTREHIPRERGEVPKILARYVTPRLCRWLEESPEGPWFASVGFYENHIPFPKSPTPPEVLERICPLPYLPDHPAIRQDLAQFYRMVQTTDRSVGDILESLAQSGQEENTIVIFTTDHGIAFPRAKCNLFDAGIGTALLMRWPGELAQNRVVSDLLSNVDLMPTLLEMVEAPVPDGVQGRSFAGLLRGGDYRPREQIYSELTWHTEYDPTRSIRTNRYKLIRHFDPIPGNLQPKDYWNCCAGSEYLSPMFEGKWPERALYDLAVDPHEQHNLSGHHGYRRLERELESRLREWMQRTGDPLLEGSVPTPESMEGSG